MRVVLVDPSRAIQHAMTDMVVQDGHEVVAFCEGLKALEHLKLDKSARALVTSIQLPDVSGLELCVAARQLAGSRRALFIIVMSSSEDFGQVVRALDNGADDFVRKPPLAEECLAAAGAGAPPDQEHHLPARNLQPEIAEREHGVEPFGAIGRRGSISLGPVAG
jgi:DNA-binding response OmpR family regulator